MKRRVLALSCLGWMMCADLITAQTTTPLPFRAVMINGDSEFTAAAALDVSGDGRLDIVAGGWWYEAPSWTRHKLRDVERIGTRFDDYSNLPLDVDSDGDLDLISVNYRSKSLYWVRNPGSHASQANQLWERVEIDVPGPSETGRLVDIDGDGQLDVLPNGTTFAAWYSLTREGPSPQDSSNKQTQVRWTKHELPKELAGHGIGSGDINGDGRLDLVGPNGWAEGPADPRKERWIWHDDFQLHRDGSVPILVHDVDSDGDVDLIWGRGHNVGLYWTEQHRAGSTTVPTSSSPSDASATELLRRAPQVHLTTLESLSGKSAWTTHAIDTSWSCIHAPLLADLDGDGKLEIVAGKRFQGHEGKDPGENEPLRVMSYQFDTQSRSWSSRLISRHAKCGLDLDPKCVDIDADGDLDIIGPARSGLVLLENLRISTGAAVPEVEWASYQPPLPAGIIHHNFQSMITVVDGQPLTLPIDSALSVGDRREQIHRQMELVMGELPDSHRRTPLDIRIETIEALDKYTRIKLSYAPEPGDRVPTWLLLPNSAKPRAAKDESTESDPIGETKWPAILCLHPTQFELGKDQLLGLGGKPSRFYAHELAEQGFVCLVPDYPGFGEYKYDFATQGKHYASGTMKAIWNNIRALDLIESLHCVKRDAIGCIGHSLGGHNALFTAAFDVRIRACMSSCGFNAFEDYYEGKLKGWTSDRYMPRIAAQYNSDPKQMPFDFHEVLAAIAPRPLLVNAPLHDANFAVEGVRKCEAAVKPLYSLLKVLPDTLTVLYPDAEHDFPEPIRQQTYAWFAKNLSGQKK